MQQLQIPEEFPVWLANQIGPAKWIVARKSKKRVADGYRVFLTQARLRALVRHFEAETGEMEVDQISLHLTEPDPTFGQKRKDTFDGMAFWAGTGPSEKTCRSCINWACDGYLASSGLLKNARCIKYKSLTHGTDGGTIPHYAKACKYFEPRDTVPPLENPKR